MLNTNPISEDYIYDMHVWQVMKFRDGLNKHIMDKIFEQVYTMLSHYSSVLMIRSEVYVAHYSLDNKLISRWMSKLKKSLSKKYRCNIGFVWVREQHNAIKQHYHLILLLNGHKVNYPESTIKLSTALCKAMGGLTYSFTKRGYYMLERNCSQSIQAAIYRASYLAKNHSKDKRPSQTKRYQASRLKPK